MDTPQDPATTLADAVAAVQTLGALIAHREMHGRQSPALRALLLRTLDDAESYAAELVAVAEAER